MGEERLGEKGSNGHTVTEVKWRENLEQCVADFGWGGVRLDSLKDMSNAEVKYM